MQVLLTEQQRKMLEWLAAHQRRSMNGVVRLAIERVYQAEQARPGAVGQAVTHRSGG
jgi:hypothetical protein